MGGLTGVRGNTSRGEGIGEKKNGKKSKYPKKIGALGV